MSDRIVYLAFGSVVARPVEFFFSCRGNFLVKLTGGNHSRVRRALSPFLLNQTDIYYRGRARKHFDFGPGFLEPVSVGFDNYFIDCRGETGKLKAPLFVSKDNALNAAVNQ